MFTEKSCGNCIKSWSKVLMWICTVLICLGGIIAIFQVTATAKREVERLQAESYVEKSYVSSYAQRKIDSQIAPQIEDCIMATTIQILIILIGAVGAIFINRFFWSICFGFGIIVHSQSGNTKERSQQQEGLKCPKDMNLRKGTVENIKIVKNPEFDENLLKYTK